MKHFELAEPATLREAIGLLDPNDPTIRPIAGGTALMQMMKTGVFRPKRLISLRKVEARFTKIDVGADGGLRIGALAPLASLERLPELKRTVPVIPETLRTLSNVRVRNVATVGGHLAHADPHMDLPPLLIALGGRVVVLGPKGERTVAIEDLFAGYFETVLAKNELIAELVVPPRPTVRAVYIKCTTRSADDWPALGVGVALDIEVDGAVKSADIVISAATEKPIRLKGAESVLKGGGIDDAVAKRAGDAAADEADPIDDARGSAGYKKQLVRVHVARAIKQAAARPMMSEASA
ncbi:MAG: FAD binding domain-containing protein [Candidatus Eiseniibacteriota bacterium]